MSPSNVKLCSQQSSRSCELDHSSLEWYPGRLGSVLILKMLHSEWTWWNQRLCTLWGAETKKEANEDDIEWAWAGVWQINAVLFCGCCCSHLLIFFWPAYIQGKFFFLWPLTFGCQAKPLAKKCIVYNMRIFFVIQNLSCAPTGNTRRWELQLQLRSALLSHHQSHGHHSCHCKPLNGGAQATYYQRNSCQSHTMHLRAQSGIACNLDMNAAQPLVGQYAFIHCKYWVESVASSSLKPWSAVTQFTLWALNGGHKSCQL